MDILSQIRNIITITKNKKDMTPYEKAEELFEKMYEYAIFDEAAKQCALIAVDEILDALKNNAANSASLYFYEGVKKEIEKQ